MGKAFPKYEGRKANRMTVENKPGGFSYLEPHRPRARGIPIQVGDVWQVGPHMFGCGDLEKGAGEELLDLADFKGVTYVDPPWGSSVVYAFRKQAAAGKGVPFSEFLTRLFRVALYRSPVAFSELGLPARKTAEAVIQHAGLTADFFNVNYYFGRPSLLLRVFKNTGQTLPTIAIPTPAESGEQDQFDIIDCVVRSTGPAPMVFDPCIGKGMIARYCHKTGRRAVGLELNPKRLAITLAWLQNNGVGVPQKISELSTMKRIPL